MLVSRTETLLWGWAGKRGIWSSNLLEAMGTFSKLKSIGSQGRSDFSRANSRATPLLAIKGKPFFKKVICACGNTHENVPRACGEKEASGVLSSACPPEAGTDPHSHSPVPTCHSDTTDSILHAVICFSHIIMCCPISHGPITWGWT